MERERPESDDEEIRMLLLAILEAAPKGMSVEELAETVRQVLGAAAS